MGLLIAAIATLLGIASTIAVLIIKPLINLNNNITKLNASVNGLNDSVNTINTRLAKHGEEIDELQKESLQHDVELKIHDEKIRTLEKRRAK